MVGGAGWTNSCWLTPRQFTAPLASPNRLLRRPSVFPLCACDLVSKIHNLLVHILILKWIIFTLDCYCDFVENLKVVRDSDISKRFDGILQCRIRKTNGECKGKLCMAFYFSLRRQCSKVCIVALKCIWRTECCGEKAGSKVYEFP